MSTPHPAPPRSSPYLVLRRPARTVPDDGSTTTITVPSPPREQDENNRNSWLQALLPIVGAFGFIGIVVISPSPVWIAMGVLFAVGMVASSVGMTLEQRRRQQRRLGRDRSKYFTQLSGVRAEIRVAIEKQWAAGRRCDPPPELLLSLTRSPNRLWERRPNHSDFLDVRFGRGPAALRVALKAPPEGGTSSNVDPLCGHELRGLLGSVDRVDGAPLRINLRASRWSLLGGDPAMSRATLRAVLAQVVFWHGPDDVRLLIASAHEYVDQWSWARWLPHLRWAESDLPQGSLLMTEPDVLQRALIHLAASRQSVMASATRNMLRPGEAPDFPGPHILVVLDGLAMDEEMEALKLLRTTPGLGITVLEVAGQDHKWEPPWVEQMLLVDAGGAPTRAPGLAAECAGGARVDATSVAVCEALARRLSPWRLPGHSLADAVSSPDVAELLQVPDVAAVHPDLAWANAPADGELRIPVGSSPDGLPVALDLKESALGGMGPHGLLVGATGSGKSELLRTLVIGLALSHPPELVSLVLVDFKGGATFAGLAELPQVSGLITNLVDQMHLVDRMRDAIEGEIARRQQLLSDVGNLASAHEYRYLRSRSRPELEALPDLIVIVDEFSELIGARPDFVDTFVAIGRVGRSLGIHLLLASQRVDEGKLRGLDSHISYRIALRTFSGPDSVSAIGSQDAYYLPPVAGSGILKVGSTLFQRFRAAHVSTPYTGTLGPRGCGMITRFDPTAQPLALVAPVEPHTEDGVRDAAEAVPTLASVVVDRLHDDRRRVHRIWLPPLEQRIPLGSVLTEVVDHAERGLVAANWTDVGRLRAPFAVVDLPRAQQVSPYAPDLSGTAGSMLVVGAPQTGKSMLLKSLVVALALTHTPTEVQIYCVDLGGGTLEELEGLPHVGGVAGRGSAEKLTRTVDQVADLLAQREELFSVLGIGSMAEYRNRRRAGQLTDQPMGDVFLLVDGIGDLRRDYESLEPVISELAARGTGFGVHVVVTATRVMDLRPALRDNLSGRLELHVNDPMDSMFDRRRAAAVPADTPGRGLASDGAMMQVLLPMLGTDDGKLPELIDRIRRAWSGPCAPAVRVLPTQLDTTALPAVGTEEPPGVPIGIEERQLAPLYLNLAGNDPHLAVLGDTESGKTTVLATYLRGLLARSKPDQVAVYLLDYRLTLLDAISPEFLAGYASASTSAQKLVTEIGELLTARAPGAELSRAELRQRNWWSGPEIYLVVDDYDLVVSGFDNLLAPLSDFIPQGHDVGFHLIVTRKVVGAARALGDAVLGRVKEFGNPGLLLSGDRAEGPLMGGQRAALHPAGRAVLVRRRSEAALVQIAQSHDQDDPTPPRKV